MLRLPFSLSLLPTRLYQGARNLLRNDQLILALLSLFIGLVGGALVIGLREAISFFQFHFYGAPGERLYDTVAGLPWWQVVAVPTLGGVAVGLLIRYAMPGGRAQGVADVIEASALRGGRMSVSTGLRAAVVNALSIGAGASVGREGPAVHLGASLAGWIAKKLHLSRSLSRTLLGCGVAAAVAGSFNAPIAGALFANEVVIGHYALKAFAPVVIASVTGTAVSRAYYGDFPAFVLPPHAITSYFEFPAFIVLGVLAGLVASLLLKAIFTAQDVSQKLPGPSWLRPGIGGLLVGVIALFLPQVLGVGYGITDDALSGSVALWLLAAVLVGKIVATALSLGFGFGGGIFSPSLVVGAMLGGAFGIVATGLMPTLQTGTGGYTLIGMGAVAAATLGAPISTTLIVFEMTGDYELTMGLMLAVVVSTGITRHISKNSFFQLQLERRGLDLKGGFESALLRASRVCDVMEESGELVSPEMPLSQLRVSLQDSKLGELFVVDGEGKLIGTITLADLSETAFDPAMDMLINAADVARRRPPVLQCDDHLEDALKKIRSSGEHLIAVVDDLESRKFLGTVEEKHVMSAYNRALLQSRHEERDV
ncbi:chloride channel protein [Magnetovibrio sp.]|uniref:chloride channel protein n=1 Tax=Magnetovibrio sp. TaxID=2024836 RepID=UPI002F957A5A